MASRAVISSVELPLRDFCEASLQLLAGSGTLGSILADVLPSFHEAIRPTEKTCGAQLSLELASWQRESQQLIRLAQLHSGSDAAGLIRGLEQVAQGSTRALEAVRELGVKRANAPAAADSEAASLTVDRAIEISQDFDTHLRAFCESTLVLLKMGPERSSVLPQTLPSLHLVFAECGPVLLARLRGELSSSRTSAEQLIELAGAHYGGAASDLQQRVQQSHDQAAQLLGALELLIERTPATERVVAGEAHLSSGKLSSPTTGQVLATQRDPQRAQEFYALGLQSQRRGDFRTAETLYTEALRLDDTLRLAWLQRGRIYVMHRQGPPAVVDLTRALQLFESDAVTLRWRADALAMCGRLADALRDYDQALDILPEDAAVRYNRAVVLRVAGQFNRAWGEFERLLRRQTNRAGTHLNRGLICLARGQAEEAVVEFQAALAVKPGLPEAIERLHQLGIETGGKNAAAKVSARTAPPVTAKPDRPSRPSQLSGKTQKTERAAPRGRASLEAGATATPEAPAENSAGDGVKHDLAMTLLLEMSSHEVDQKSPQSDQEKKSSAEQPTVTSPGESSSIPAIEIKPLHIPGGGAANSPETSSIATAMLAGKLPPRTQPSAHGNTSMQVHCPSCDERSSLRWDQLQSGKTIACRRCAQRFSVQPDGNLQALVKNWRGSWRPLRERNPFWSPRAVLTAVVGSCMLLWFSMTYIQTKNYDAIIAEDPGYPKELALRAELFTLAWLKGDYRTMRQLTDDLQSRELYIWAMSNPAPPIISRATLERDAQVKVQVVNENDLQARVQIRIDGLQLATGGPVSQMLQDWRREGERWKFTPTTRPDS